jgi:hypothetical protein
MRYGLRLKKQLNIEHVMQHSTTIWQNSYEIIAWVSLRIKKRLTKEAVE